MGFSLSLYYPPPIVPVLSWTGNRKERIVAWFGHSRSFLILRHHGPPTLLYKVVQQALSFTTPLLPFVAASEFQSTPRVQKDPEIDISIR
ncbi:hypothetical protein TNCV_2632071 [Trichonephila clavipes]|nr:hypothetical protein TNCV_2632071 [Trichonephila clavipes]